jgi:hypothetical protein
LVGQHELGSGKVIAYEVYCHACGKPWEEQDPGVRFIYTDHVWECWDAGLCAERRAMNRLTEGTAG